MTHAPDIESAESPGIHLTDLSAGDRLEIHTANHQYHVEYLGGVRARVSGHPRICPEPTLVDILGSTSRNAGFKWSFVGEGLRLKFQKPGVEEIVTTTPIKSVTVMQKPH